MKRRIISLCLAAGLLAGSLWGCFAPEGGGENPKARQEENASQGAADAAGGTIPMGRYVESSLSISLENGEMVADVIRTSDNSLEMYTVKDNKAARYVLNGGQWEKQDKSLLEGIEFPYDTLHMLYGGDGNRYVLYQADEYRTSMLRLTEGKEPEALLTDVFSAKNEREYYDVRPDYAEVAKDGSILLSVNRETRVYSPQGELLFSMPQESSSTEWRYSGILDKDQYITIGAKGFLVYNISSRSASAAGEIPYQSSQPDLYQSSQLDAYSPMASDGEGGVFIVNAKGIHHMNKGGSIWETVVDGELNSLSLPSAYAKKLFVGNDNDFYVWMTQSDREEIKHYTYDDQMPAVPSEILTIYGLDLGDLDTVRQAASMFQLEHPDVKVELIDGQMSGGSTTVSDTIRALNTELLGGNGADILVLDGLPVDSYIEKGVLMDMKDLLAPMIASGELMGQVSEPFTEEDGGIYQIPTRMILLVAYGDQDAIRSLSSMEAMRTYQSGSSLPLRPKTTYGNLVRQILSLSYDEIVDRSTGKPVQGKIQELLETAKLLGDACGAKAVFDESEDGGRGLAYNRKPGTDGLIGSEFERVDRSQSAIAIDKVKGMFDMMLPLAVQRKNGLSMENVNNSYLPKGAMGINQASARRELAEEFILYALGREVQGSDLNDGLPVNAKAAGDWVERENSSVGSVSVGGTDGYALEGSWPAKEERQRIFDIASRADRPIRTDRVLEEIISNETEGYFDGTLSLEQAVRNAQNKADLYFAE